MINLGAGLEDQVVVVTGAGGAIGQAVTRMLADCGAHVCGVDVDESALRATMSELPSTEQHCCPWDLADVATHAEMFGGIREAIGVPTGLANLAAVLRRRHAVETVAEADWDLQHDVNLKAAFFLNTAFVKQLGAERRRAAIVNFTSQSWWTGGYGGAVAYAASKGGIVSMTRGLSRTWADRDVRVNTVAPGAVDTPMLRSGQSDADLARFMGARPDGPNGRPRGDRPGGRLPTLDPQQLYHRRDARHQRRAASVLSDAPDLR